MSLTVMGQSPFCVRLPWLAVGLLISVLIGCHKKDESSAASATATPTPLPVESPQPIEEAPLSDTPSPDTEGTPGKAAEPAPEPETPVLISVDSDTESGGAPLTVKFTAEVTGGPPGLHYRWDFGDKTPPVPQLNAEHTYRQAGEYTATFWATGPPDIKESEEIDIEVTEEGFDVDIETDSDVGPAPLTVEFSARLFQEDEDSAKSFYFQWDFGDGARDVSNPTTHTYRSPGAYTATLTATNPQGQHAVREVEIQVDAPDEATQDDG